MMGYNFSLEETIELIRSAYGSINEPNFGRVKKKTQNPIYARLLSELRQRFVLDEITDHNQDVSLVFDVDTEAGIPAIRFALSMVGLFAYIEPVREGLDSEKGIALRETLDAFGVMVLEESFLETAISMPMNYTDKEDVCLYNALFSDIRPPWLQVKHPLIVKGANEY